MGDSGEEWHKMSWKGSRCQIKEGLVWYAKDFGLYVKGNGKTSKDLRQRGSMFILVC